MKTLLDKVSIHAVLLFLFLLVLSALIGGGNLQMFSYSALFVFTVLCIAACLHWTGYVLTVFIAACVSLELGYRLYFNERVSLVVLKSIADTNSHEAATLILDVAPLFLIASVPFFIILYLYRRIKGKVHVNAILLMLMASVLLSAYAIIKEPQRYYRFLPDAIARPESFGNFYYDKNNLLFGAASVLVSTQATRAQYREDVERVKSQYVMDDPAPGRPLVVFVLGETSFSGRYSLYGYDKLTTPTLDALRYDPSACVFDKVHSSSPITRDSLAMTLSFHTPENHNPLLEEKSVIELAQDNDYKTYWITAQKLEGLQETKYGFLATESDVIRFTDWEDSKLPGYLKRELDRMARAKEEKSFVVLHMAGSHRPYENKFDPIDERALPDADDYDKSIHKTDRVLARVMETLEQQDRPYIMFFTSDHGEIVGRGHGMKYGNGDQYRIPYLMKSSELDDDICKYVEGLRNDNGYISGLSNRFVLLSLLGYNLDEQFVQAEVDHDRVLHPDGKVYPWPDIPTEDSRQ